MYEQNCEPPAENNYDQFYIDLKEAIKKSNREVTKFYMKIGIFTEVFNLLPPGSWAVCDIPLTYWLLIYRVLWDEVIKCIENGKSFPYEKIEEMRVTSLVNELDLNGDDDEEEEVVEEVSDFEDENYEY